MIKGDDLKFPESRVLTIRTEDYFKIKGIDAHRYEPVGLHCVVSIRRTERGLDKFLESMPADIEVVTDYKIFSIATVDLRMRIEFHYGTGLILKKEN